MLNPIERFKSSILHLNRESLMYKTEICEIIYGVSYGESRLKS